jgi:hypothetical protein
MSSKSTSASIGEPHVGIGAARKWSSDFRRKSRIHCGSLLNSEIFATSSRVRPLGALNR